MATIPSSGLTAEQWVKIDRDLSEQLGTREDFRKLFEMDITKDQSDYINLEPRRPGKSKVADAMSKMKELDRSLLKFSPSMTNFTKAMTSATITTDTSTINTTDYTREIKEGDARFGPDGVEFYHGGRWKPMIKSTDIKSGSITGLRADSIIVDDIQEEQIVSDNTDVLASIKKANQLDVNALDIKDRTLDFTGGMVAMYIKDKGFRRKGAAPCQMTFLDFYDGKRKGVICKLVSDDHHGGAFPHDLSHIEIPVNELTSYFKESEVLKMLGEMTVYAEGTAPIRAANLYSEESIAGLPDFGAF